MKTKVLPSEPENSNTNSDLLNKRQTVWMEKYRELSEESHEEQSEFHAMNKKIAAVEHLQQMHLEPPNIVPWPRQST